MGQALFKRIQFVCCYFRYKASRAGARWRDSPRFLLVAFYHELFLHPKLLPVVMLVHNISTRAGGPLRRPKENVSSSALLLSISFP